MKKTAAKLTVSGHKIKGQSTTVFHLMLIPGVLLTFAFSYLPLLGSIMAFQDFRPVLGFFGSEWVGWDNFTYLFNLPNFWPVIRNTVLISFAKIVLHIIVPVTVALLLNELRSNFHKRVFQTCVYLPHFLSWVILSGIFIDMLSPSTGIINKFLGLFGVEPIFFLSDKYWFPAVMIISDVWKGFGFGTVVYLAALTNVDPGLYEAAMIDGANRWQQTLHVTLPGILPIVILMTVMSLGNVLNAGFDQIFNLLSPPVFETGEIIDTMVYRMGMIQRQYSPAAAMGLFKSCISFVFVSLSYYLADRFAGYRVF